MKTLGIASFVLLSAVSVAAPAPKPDGFTMDIPTEWMIISQEIRKDVTDLGSEEIDFRWNPSGKFFTPLKTFTSSETLDSRHGTFSSSYTSINMFPSWQHLGLRIRGELSYANFSQAANDLNLHELNFVAGTALEPKLARWNSGGVGVFVGGLWQQWFAPESRQSSAQSGYGGGLQSGLELRQRLAALSDTDIKAVLNLARRDYFIATPYRGQWMAQLGFSFTL